MSGCGRPCRPGRSRRRRHAALDRPAFRSFRSRARCARADGSGAMHGQGDRCRGLQRRAQGAGHRDRGERRVGGTARPFRLDRHPRAGRARAAPAAEPVPPPRPGDRGRAARPPAAEARAVRRDHLPRPAHRLLHRRAHRAGRDRDLRRPGLHHLGPARRFGLLLAGPAVRRIGTLAAGQRRGLRPLRDHRLHRRQLPGRDRPAPERGREPGGDHPRAHLRARRQDRPHLRPAARAAAAAPGRGTHGRGLPAAGACRPAGDRPHLPPLLPRHHRSPEPRARADRHAARDAELRLRGLPADRARRGRARSAAGSPAGPPSWRCPRPWPASTA